MKTLDKIIAEITKRIVNKFKPESIYLFGSHVWGNPDKNSDLDFLIIVKESSLTPVKRATLAYQCLRDIPYPLDIVVKTYKEVEKFSNVCSALEYKILNQGKLLYG